MRNTPRLLIISCIAMTLSDKGSVLRADLLSSIDAQDFSLVEIGSFGQMRVLSFQGQQFEKRKLVVQNLLIGVSRAGDQLIISAKSGRSSPTPNNDVYITTLPGQILSTIHPQVQWLTAFYADLSPDGRSIAFVGSFAETFGKTRIYGLHLLTLSDEIRTLVRTAEAEMPRSIGWSSDGRTVVYDSGNRVLLYDLARKKSKPLADGNHPTWSPDGRWIAYRRLDGTAALISPDGNHSNSIPENLHIAAGLRWSPDSRYVVFTDAGGIRVRDLTNGQSETVFVTIDQYTEIGLRWVRGLPR